MYFALIGVSLTKKTSIAQRDMFVNLFHREWNSKSSVVNLLWKGMMESTDVR
jgi:hypothetical protein